MGDLGRSAGSLPIQKGATVISVAVGSAFRNCAGPQIRNYFRQVAALRNHLGPEFRLRVIAAEGDSTDSTREELVRASQDYSLAIDLIDASHGQRVFASTEESDRMVALSKVGNCILSGVNQDDHVLVYVESDLIWDRMTMRALINLVLIDPKLDVVAPMPFAGAAFYDIWAFRKDGTRFSPFSPYHSKLRSVGMTEVDSVGSCLVMKADVARQVRMKDGAIVEWCDNARAAGFKIFCHRDYKVWHP